VTRLWKWGVSVLDISTVLQLYLNEQRVGYFIKDSKQYYVLMLADKNYRSKPIDLGLLTVRNAQKDLVPLENLVKFHYVSRPPRLLRYNRNVSAVVSASVVQGKTMAM